MGSDVHPYYLRRGDQASPTEPYVFGEPVDVVEVPVTWGLDDFPAFEFVWGMNAGLASPSNMEEVWRGDFDYAYQHAPSGVYVLTMHPQVIGRGHRMLMLERLVEHIAGHDGVVFETISEYVDRWRAANPLDRWEVRTRGVRRTRHARGWLIHQPAPDQALTGSMDRVRGSGSGSMPRRTSEPIPHLWE